LLDGPYLALVAGTGRGKRLCYQLPMAQLLRRSKRARALYVAPTKALAQDQARRLRELGAPWVIPALYDGDTPPGDRATIRRTANVLLTNPDMLSAGILPRIDEWAGVLSNLELVVVDEAHVYRGVFGSHVACVLRRLLRLCASVGARPVIVLSSGTIANPEEHAELLLGRSVEAIGDEGAPSSGRDIVLWNPALEPNEAGELVRGSPLGDAARIYADLVEAGTSTIVFTRSRKACELVHQYARDRLSSRGRDDLAELIAPYRGGYTPQERREVERALAAGELRGVAATNALELGIDIGSLDAAVCVTWPGSVTSLRQQWGRAGRRATRGLAVLVAGHDALDQYFMHEPEVLAGAPVERARLNHANPRILDRHVAVAAIELPLTDGDADPERFGLALHGAIERLCAQGLLRQTGKGWTYVGDDHPAGGLSLRGLDGHDVAIVDQPTGQLLGTVERWRAPGHVHPGAVYLHAGRSYLVEGLDMDRGVALVSEQSVPWYTRPKVDTSIRVSEVLRTETFAGGLELHFGRVTVRDQVLAYQRTDLTSHAQIDVVALQLPPHVFETEAVWFAPPADVVDDLELDDLLSWLHAAEHAMIAMLPLIAICDRADIGGLSTNWHDDLQGPAIFIYDGHPGGVGIVESGLDAIGRWVAATLRMLDTCPCEDGCPSCVQSPKCGNLNEYLDKHGALEVLVALGERVAGAGAGTGAGA
jgi:DEAD/DEAH box helicase domain-containing protein